MPASIAVGLLFLGATLEALAQSAAPAQKPPNPQTDPTSALEFLGSYTAPSAVLTTETSHASARPPSPPADTRLRRIEGVFAMLPPWPTDFAWSPEAAQRACPEATNIGKSSLQGQWLEGERALREGQFVPAAAVFERLSESRPACAPAVWNHALAEAYARSAGARAAVESALAAAPAASAGRLLLVVVQLLSGDLEGAQSELAALDAEAKAGPEGAPQISSRPGENRPPGAESVKGARARDALWACAMVAWGAGNPREARQWLARLAELEPDSAAVWFELGGVALEEARLDSRRLAELAPDSVWNRRLQAEAVETRYPGLARNLREKGLEAPSAEAAPESSQGSQGPGSESPQQLYLETRAALRVSEAAYSRASAAPRFQAYLHAMRALAAEQEDDEAAAMREYNLGLAEDPESALLHAGLGHLYRRRMDLPSAERELAEAWRLDPSDPVVAFELGDTEQRLGKPQPALELLNQALEFDAGLLVARWSRGKTYLALGDNERALADLEAAAPADPSGELQWQLARLYRKLGRADLAELAEKRSEEQRKAAGRKLETNQ